MEVAKGSLIAKLPIYGLLHEKGREEKKIEEQKAMKAMKGLNAIKAFEIKTETLLAHCHT